MHTGQPNGIRFSWDESYEVRLLLEIITVQANVSGLAIDWGVVAGGVKEGLTPKACMLVPTTPPTCLLPLHQNTLLQYTLQHNHKILLPIATMPRGIGSRFSWDENTERRLLLNIIAAHGGLSGLDLSAIASGMSEDLTAQACASVLTSLSSHFPSSFYTHLPFHKHSTTYIQSSNLPPWQQTVLLSTGMVPPRSGFLRPFSPTASSLVLTGPPSRVILAIRSLAMHAS